VNGHIILADESAIIPRIGQIQNAQLIYGSRTITTTLEVIDSEFPFIIGMDIFHQLGLSITGFVQPSDDAQLLPEPREDSKPSLIPGTTPEEELSEEFINAKKELMAALDSYLQENAA